MINARKAMKIADTSNAKPYHLSSKLSKPLNRLSFVIESKAKEGLYRTIIDIDDFEQPQLRELIIGLEVSGFSVWTGVEIGARKDQDTTEVLHVAWEEY